jgi:hypothetical protein
MTVGCEAKARVVPDHHPRFNRRGPYAASDRPRIWSTIYRKRIEAEPRCACVGASAVAFPAQQLIAAPPCCRGELSPDL